MAWRTVSGIVFVLLLISMLTLVFDIQPVKAATITVPDDYPTIQGAVDNANEGDTIFVRAGTYYENLQISMSVSLMGENIEDTIIDGKNEATVVYVKASNVSISGFRIRNSGRVELVPGWLINPYYSCGILCDNVANVTIADNMFLDNSYGLHMEYCNFSKIMDNTFTDNTDQGFWLFGGSGNILRRNTMEKNRFNFGVDGETLGEFIHDIDNTNTVDGKPVYYWINQSNRQVPADAGYVAVVNSTDITVKDLTLANNLYGANIIHTKDSVMQNITVLNNYCGIAVYFQSSNITVSNNWASGNTYSALSITDSSNSIFKDNNITNNYYGLLLDSESLGNTVSGNNITSNENGIWLRSSSNNAISENVINDSKYGIRVWGEELSQYVHSIDISNLVNGKPIYYFVNQTDLTINATTHPQVGYLALINCDDAIIESLNLTSNGQGLLLAYTNRSSILSNTISRNQYGIDLQRSMNNTIYGNILTDNDGRGIWLSNSSGNTISQNDLTDNNVAVNFVYSTNNTVFLNNITHNKFAIYMWDSSSNSIFGNEISNTYYDGMWLKGSCNNTIFHNDFILRTGYTHQVYILDPNESVNSWDNGYPSGGNYWSDYDEADSYSGPYQNETGSDSISDEPYVFDVNNTDNYPLMGPWTKIGENSTVFHASGVSLIFANVTFSGITTVNESQTGPDPPSGFKLALETPTYYDVETTANYSGPIKFNTPYNDTGLIEDEENSLQLMHWNETLQQWEDITTRVDTAENTIYGETSHLSMFALITPIFHDITMTEVTTFKTVVGQGYASSVNMTITNQGKYPETFNVTVYANTSIIGTFTNLTLTKGDSTTLILTWNTTGFDKGNYTISAYAWPVPFETDTADNNFTDSWLVVAMLGDITGPEGWPDGKCNIKDVAMVARLFGTISPDPRYDPNCDLTGPTKGVPDCKIDIKDVATVAKHYGEINS